MNVVRLSRGRKRCPRASNAIVRQRSLVFGEARIRAEHSFDRLFTGKRSLRAGECVQTRSQPTNPRPSVEKSEARVSTISPCCRGARAAVIVIEPQRPGIASNARRSAEERLDADDQFAVEVGRRGSPWRLYA